MRPMLTLAIISLTESAKRRWTNVDLMFDQRHKWRVIINPFKPEFTIVIFIHYKPWVAVATLDF